MPRGDKPTTPALALKDGWVYEDTLPASITKEEYDWWFKESLVLDGVRMGPPLTTKPQSTTEETPEPCPFCGSAAEPTNMFNQDERLIGCSLRKCVLFYSKIRLPEWNTRISPASAAPVVKARAERAANAIFDYGESVRWGQGTDQFAVLRMIEIIESEFAAAATAAPQVNCANCGGSGEIEIGCAMDHALTAPCVECKGTGQAAPVEQSIDPVGDFVEQVWKLTNDRDGWSRITLRGAVENFARQFTATPSSTSARAATAEQPDPSTCPGCASGRCMVHEPIIRTDATSIARGAAEEIAKEYYFSNDDTRANWKGREQEVHDDIAAIIKRHYEGAR